MKNNSLSTLKNVNDTPNLKLAALSLSHPLTSTSPCREAYPVFLLCDAMRFKEHLSINVINRKHQSVGIGLLLGKEKLQEERPNSESEYDWWWCFFLVPLFYIPNIRLYKKFPRFSNVNAAIHLRWLSNRRTSYQVERGGGFM